MKVKIRSIVTASMLAGLCCVATMVIKIPSPLHGYVNLGDCMVLLSGWFLPPAYGFTAAGIGSALADLFSGYVVYAPATFMIKGVMAIIAHFCFKGLHHKLSYTSSRIIGGALAEIEMILGYFVFEGFMYGFAPSAINIPANGVQGMAGLIIGMILVKIFEKSKLF
ncbi:MAG: ECF transporter S component [Ruminococcaceae bacterium]|nr:ECF transporter S component [Oscillospiraceae bacterium]